MGLRAAPPRPARGGGGPGARARDGRAAGARLPHAASRGAGAATRRADHLVAGPPPGDEPALSRSHPDRGGRGAARPRAEPPHRHRRAGPGPAGGGRAGRARRRRRVPGARGEPRLRELPGGPPVPRWLDLREPGLSADGGGRRRAGGRLRRAVVPVEVAPGGRGHGDPARRRSLLFPLPHALLPVRRSHRRRAGGRPPAPGGSGPPPDRPVRRGSAADAARRVAPGPA